MMIFTQHPHDQGITYFEHWGFAMGIAWRLLRSVVAFAVHAVLPWITIEKQLDLEATSAYLMGQNDFIEAAAKAGRTPQDIPPLGYVGRLCRHSECTVPTAGTRIRLR